MTPTATADAADQALVEALRRRGYRVTSQRLVIGRLLRESDRHVTADEVLRRAGAHLPGVSLPTVYATLVLFVDSVFFKGPKPQAMSVGSGCGVHLRLAFHGLRVRTSRNIRPHTRQSVWRPARWR